MVDLPDQLMDAADKVDELPRAELQILLRKAALMIRDLRTLVNIRDEVWLEDVPPEGRG
jgi:hypothetical protein